MTLLQSIFLGLLQGLTEFLPVSSSGHLALAQYVMQLPDVPVAYDVLLHISTLIAVIIVLRPEIKTIYIDTVRALSTKRIDTIPKLVWFIIIGSIPAIFAGLFLETYMEQIFSSVKLMSFGFLFTGILLSIASRIKKGNRNLADMKWKDSLLIGTFQAIAILPSISRSGSTISGSIFSGFSSSAAFTFSFLLSIPAILGAALLHADELLLISRADMIPYVCGFIAAFISGYFALRIFKKVLISNKLHIFAYYCICLALLILFLI